MGVISFTINKLTDPQVLETDWRDLEERADGSFFLSWNWIGCWLETIEAEVFVLEGRAEDRVVALALLCPVRRKRFGCFREDAVYLNQTGDPSADRVAIEYNGILLDRSVAPDGARQALHSLVGGGPQWEQLFVRGLSSDFANVVAAGGFGARARLRSQSPTAAVDLLALRREGKNYLDRCSANTRAQIRRSIRRYEERGALQLDIAGDVPQAHAFFQEMKDLHRRYWNGRGDAGAFSNDFVKAFHQRLIETAMPKGHIELFRLSAGETAIGYLYNFKYRGTVLYYSSGFEYEQDNRLKPGLVSHALCIERHLADGMDRYDFMAGAARYKSSLGEAGPAIFAYVLERPGLKLTLKDGLRRIRDVVRQ